MLLYLKFGDTNSQFVNTFRQSLIKTHKTEAKNRDWHAKKSCDIMLIRQSTSFEY